MVVLLAMVPIVVLFMLLPLMAPGVSIGPLALLYLYALRGGASRDGVACGAFYILTLSGSGRANWDSGAALSFKL